MRIPSEPIKDENILKKIESHLKQRDFRYYLFFRMILDTGMNATDLFSFTMKDIDTYHVTATDSSGKIHTIFLSEQTKESLRFHCSRNNITNKNKLLFPNMKYHTVCHRFTLLGNEIGFNALNTTCIKKTFGYNLYQAEGDIVLIQNLFNHETSGITYGYICVNDDQATFTQEKIEECIKELSVIYDKISINPDLFKTNSQKLSYLTGRLITSTHNLKEFLLACEDRNR